MMRYAIQKLEPFLIKIYRRWVEPPPPNLVGDRDIEWSFVAAHIGNGPGKAMDFGCGTGYLGMMAVQAGYETVAVDFTRVVWDYSHPKLKFLQGDFLKMDFGFQSFDLIINCSSIEHTGLAGRYGFDKEQPDGDLIAMVKMREILRPNGKMILTIPVGKDNVFMPYHRVYGINRLPHLLEKFTIEHEEYWTKNDKNQWVLTEKKVALEQEPRLTVYGLGCFVLRPLV